ncbi:hypothetical protein SAY86_006747 [Trapa natans]|uniref:Uncharacterized protein n=1 Tax=Trapa natans TaxID=22666 RepID=A0AAN7L7Y0_TRANT|nr:hypothetical protein SAY86_006747 [Trapa natans]
MLISEGLNSTLLYKSSLHIIRSKNILMKSRKKAEHGHGGDEARAESPELEILKAVAQAWHARSGSSPAAASEFDARRLSFRTRPSRFMLEAMRRRNELSSSKGIRFGRSSGIGYWDFRQSLWDSYEILAVSRRLERGMVMDGDPFSGDPTGRALLRRRRESMNSLRNLFNFMSSRRFIEAKAPYEQDSQLDDVACR